MSKQQEQGLEQPTQNSGLINKHAGVNQQALGRLTNILHG
jgi:hypothetical protein